MQTAMANNERQTAKHGMFGQRGHTIGLLYKVVQTNVHLPTSAVIVGSLGARCAKEGNKKRENAEG